MPRPLCPLLLVSGWLSFGSVVFAEDKAELAARARRVFEQSCRRCHNGEGSDSGASFDVLKRETLLVTAEGNDKPYLTPGSLDKSRLWDRIADGTMPKRRSPERAVYRPEDKEIIRQWIAAGAPDFPKITERKFLGLEVVLKAIKNDLAAADKRDRPNLRYFTLTHLHNNPTVSDDQLRVTRAALAKAVNSLSWSQDLVELRSVADTADTVYAVNVSKLLWTRDHWRAILEAYPYGLQYGSHKDEQLRALDDDIQLLIEKKEVLIHVRADWFVATAMRPPLYHALLYDDYLPKLRRRGSDPKNLANSKHMNASDLEDFLNVDVKANLLANDPQARRAGFARSGVSGHNRLIERHPLKGAGAYWLSYDFKTSTWEANLQQFPLGPVFKGNPYNEQAFVHAGGEIIFHLPNGLQGYLLVNEKGDRIDTGPIEVVSDALKTSGTPAIVNGLSCMACHKNGMIVPPKDLVREGTGVFGKARDRVRLLYPPTKEMEQLIKKDGDLFVRALEQTVGPYLRVGANKDLAVKDLPEPIGEVARKYLLEDVDLTMAAAELYMADPKRLKQRIEDNDDLRRLGLGALVAEGGFVKRGAWESVRGTSQMQQAARELGFTPLSSSGRR